MVFKIANNSIFAPVESNPGIKASIIKSRMNILKKPKTDIAVIGGGSWATALVKILSQGDSRVRWSHRNKEKVRYIRRFKHNPTYLSDVHFSNRKVKPDHRFDKVLKDTKYIFIVVPSAFLPETLDQIDPALLKGKKIISAVK